MFSYRSGIHFQCYNFFLINWILTICNNQFLLQGIEAAALSMIFGIKLLPGFINCKKISIFALGIIGTVLRLLIIYYWWKRLHSLMDRTSDFGSDSEGSNPSAVTFNKREFVYYWNKIIAFSLFLFLSLNDIRILGKLHFKIYLNFIRK